MRRWRLPLARPRFTLAALLVLITIVAIPLAYVAQRRAWNLKRKAAYRLLREKRASLSSVTYETGGGGMPEIFPYEDYDNWWQRLTLYDDSFEVKMAVFFIAPHQNQEGTASFTESDFELLLLFPEIERLILCGGKGAPLIQGEFLERLSGASALTTLELKALDSLDGQYLSSLKRCSRLEQLIIQGCPKINDMTLRKVQLPKSVRSLECTECFLGDETLARWLKQTRLQKLKLDTMVSGKAIRELANNTLLESLCIRNAPVLDDDLDFLGTLPNLHTLSLIAVPAKGAFLKKFSHASKLQYLSLRSTLLSDENASELARFSKLTALDLGWTPVTGGFLKPFSNAFPRTIWLHGTRFSDEGNENLGKLTILKSVRFPANWSVEEIERFSKRKTPSPISESSYEDDQSRDEAMNLTLWTRFDAGGVDSLDRTPLELMGPVMRLQQLAAAEEKE